MKKYISNGNNGDYFSDDDSNAVKTYKIAQIIYDESFYRTDYCDFMEKILTNDFIYDGKDYKNSGWVETVCIWFPDFEFDFDGAYELFFKEDIDIIDEEDY